MSGLALEAQIELLHRRLEEAQQTIRALMSGEVDAVVQEEESTLLLLRVAQRKMRASEQLLRAVFDGATDAMLLADDDGRYVDANPAACRLFGLGREALVGRRIADFAAPGFSPAATWDDFVARRHLSGEFPLLRVDGTRRDLEYNAVADVLPGVHLSVLRDVTDHKVAQVALRTSQQLLEEAQAFAHLGSWSAGATRDAPIRWSAECARIFGVDPATPPTPAGLRELAHPDDRVRVVAEHDRAAAAGLPLETEHRIVRPTGEVRWIFAKSVVEGVGVVQDITERKRAQGALQRVQEQLRQAQKMEAIGNLAGGVAHDFNNLLTVILSYTEMLMEDLQPDDPLCQDLEQVHQAGRRATEVTRQLLAFSRKQILQPVVLDVNEIVLGVRKMLGRLLGEDIELSLLTSPDAGKIHADAGQIEQVVMNLVVNARDAMPDGGDLTLEISNVVLDAADATEHAGVVPGPYVVIRVTDTGIGMDQATQARIFEPFFTTKDKSKGTGLGLSTVYGIVQQTGGHVRVHSEPGRGTTFEVCLPRTDLPVEPVAPPADEPDSLRGDETVLLVEDDAPVRAIMQAILRKSGYVVLAVENGGEAFLVSEKFPGRIDLLLTDVVMPRMSGRQLAERLALQRPGLKVLFVSGYTEDTIVHHGVRDAGIAFLAKPITPDALLRKVRQVLDGRLRRTTVPADRR